MRITLTFLLLLTLSTHWHHKEQTRVREYVSLRADQPDAVAQASEHFNVLQTCEGKELELRIFNLKINFK